MKTNWDLNDFHTGFLVLVQLKIIYLLYKHINESCYMHFQGLLYGSRRKSLWWRLNAIKIFDDYFAAVSYFSVSHHAAMLLMRQNFLLDESTIQTPKLYSTHHVQPTEQQMSEWTANESFLRLLSCAEVELFVLHRTRTATPNLCIVWSLRAFKR